MNTERENNRRPFAEHAVRWLSSFFFIGYVPKGSGTAASAAGSLLWVLLSPTRAYPWIVLCTAAAGFLTAGYAERVVFREKDSPKIVLDEVAGIFITFLTFVFSPSSGFFYLTAGLVLFRIFDIVKPFPISRLERLEGGAGIMLDDIASGIISNGILQGIRLIARRG